MSRKDLVTGLDAKAVDKRSKYIVSLEHVSFRDFPLKAAELLSDLGIPAHDAKVLKNIQMMVVSVPDNSHSKRMLFRRDDLLVEEDRSISIAAPPPGKGPNKNDPDGGGGGSSSSQFEVWNNSINPRLSLPNEDGTKWNTSNNSGRIFILDTGISSNTDDLNIDETLSIDFTGSKRRVGWRDQNGHGTHVAGTAAAINDNDGIAGIAAGATVVSVKVLDRRGSGSISGVLEGVNHVAANAKPGDVANLSLGGGVSTLLDSAVRTAAEQTGALFALAAGNDADLADRTSPARSGDPGLGIFTIAAHNQNLERAYFSNYGQPVSHSAPGVDITSLGIDGSLVTWNGTSMASPAAAGHLFMTGNLQGSQLISHPDGRDIPSIQITDFIA